MLGYAYLLGLLFPFLIFFSSLSLPPSLSLSRNGVRGVSTCVCQDYKFVRAALSYLQDVCPWAMHALVANCDGKPRILETWARGAVAEG